MCTKDDADSEYHEAEVKWEEKMQQEQKNHEIAAEKICLSPAAVLTPSPLKIVMSNESPAKPAKNRMSVLESWSYDDEKEGLLCALI